MLERVSKEETKENMRKTLCIAGCCIVALGAAALIINTLVSNESLVSKVLKLCSAGMDSVSSHSL